MPFHRITIWGNSGSGKSTLAEIAGARLGLPVFHLDLIAWERGWKWRADAAFRADQQRWLGQSAWIIEGVGGTEGMIERFHAADLIIHLDAPAALCQQRAARRITEDRAAKNRFMAEGCRYYDVVEKQTAVIQHFEVKLRGEVEALLRGKFPGKPQLRLDGTQSMDALCEKLVERVGGMRSC